MFTTSITNPKTNRSNKVAAWKVAPKKFWPALKSGSLDAKKLSWKLLNDDESVQAMEEQIDGDSAESNFALSIFENALDWAIGLAIINYCNAMIARHKILPKPFTLMVNKKGDVFIETASGNLIPM
jgi:hypothetical protein